MARLHRLPWRLLAGMLLALIGCALGWLWFRDSSFAAVERVSITGSGSSESAQVRVRARGRRPRAEHAAPRPQGARGGRRAVRLGRRRCASSPTSRTTCASRSSSTSRWRPSRPAAGASPRRAAGWSSTASAPPTCRSCRAASRSLDGRVQDRARARGPQGRGGRAARAARPRRAPVLRPRRDDARPARRARADLRQRRRRPRRSGARRPGCWPRTPPPGATYLDLRVPKLVAAGGVGPVPDPDPEPTPAPGVVESNPQP